MHRSYQPAGIFCFRKKEYEIGSFPFPIPFLPLRADRKRSCPAVASSFPLLIPIALLLLSLLGLGGVGHTATRAADPEKSADSQPTGKQPTDKKPVQHFLWKVQSGKSTVYLLGSVHVGRKELYPLDDVIGQAFRQSDRLVLELLMDRKTEFEAGLKLMQAAKLPAGDTLDKHLDEATKTLLNNYAKKSKFPLERFRGFRPWFVALLITQIEMPKHGYTAEYGLDRHFRQKADDAGKKTAALETVDDQVAVFAKLSEEAQRLFLKETLEDVNKIGQMLKKMFAAWKTGDVKAMESLVLKDFQRKEYQPLYRALFVRRNKKWMKQIEGYLQGEQTTFIVVGAGHLIGKDGLIELLRAKKKYKITQL